MLTGDVGIVAGCASHSPYANEAIDADPKPSAQPVTRHAPTDDLRKLPGNLRNLRRVKAGVIFRRQNIDGLAGHRFRRTWHGGM